MGLGMAGVLVWSPLAAAHGNTDLSPFYVGILDWVLHWQQALFLVAGGCWCGQQRTADALRLGSSLVGGLLAAAVAVLLGIVAAVPVLGAAFGYMLAGLAVAAQLQAAYHWPLMVGVAAGFASGLGLEFTAAADGQQALLFVLGMLVGVLLLMFYVAAAAIRLPDGWPRIGLRVVGSWIAAIGMMVCAFSLAL